MDMLPFDLPSPTMPTSPTIKRKSCLYSNLSNTTTESNRNNLTKSPSRSTNAHNQTDDRLPPLSSPKSPLKLDISGINSPSKRNSSINTCWPIEILQEKTKSTEQALHNSHLIVEKYLNNNHEIEKQRYQIVRSISQYMTYFCPVVDGAIAFAEIQEAFTQPTVVLRSNPETRYANQLLVILGKMLKKVGISPAEWFDQISAVGSYTLAKIDVNLFSAGLLGLAVHCRHQLFLERDVNILFHYIIGSKFKSEMSKHDIRLAFSKLFMPEDLVIKFNETAEMLRELNDFMIENNLKLCNFWRDHPQAIDCGVQIEKNKPAEAVYIGIKESEQMVNLLLTHYMAKVTETNKQQASPTTTTDVSTSTSYDLLPDAESQNDNIDDEDRDESLLKIRSVRRTSAYQLQLRGSMVNLELKPLQLQLAVCLESDDFCDLDEAWGKAPLSPLTPLSAPLSPLTHTNIGRNQEDNLRVKHNSSPEHNSKGDHLQLVGGPCGRSSILRNSKCFLPSLDHTNSADTLNSPISGSTNPDQDQDDHIYFSLLSPTATNRKHLQNNNSFALMSNSPPSSTHFQNIE